MADSTEQGIVAPLMGLPLSGARPAPSSTSVATMVSFHIWAPSQAPSWALKMFPMDCKQGLFDKEYQYINGRKAAASFFSALLVLNSLPDFMKTLQVCQSYQLPPKYAKGSLVRGYGVYVWKKMPSL